MKRPLFPDGFLINAHHSHPSARQEEPPPSFLSPRAPDLLLLSLLPWGQVEGPSGAGGCRKQRGGRVVSPSLLPGILQVGSTPPVGTWHSAFPGSAARPVPWGLLEQKSWPPWVQFSLAGHLHTFSRLRQDLGLLSVRFSFPSAVVLFEPNLDG